MSFGEGKQLERRKTNSMDRNDFSPDSGSAGGSLCFSLCPSKDNTILTSLEKEKINALAKSREDTDFPRDATAVASPSRAQ